MKKLIQKTILSQSEDFYPFHTIHHHLCLLLNTQQGSLTHAEYYKRWNTKCNVAKAVGVMLAHQAGVEYTVQQKYHTDYDLLSKDEHEKVKELSEDAFVSYLFLQHSGA